MQLVPEGQRGTGEEEGEPGRWQGRKRGLQPLLRLHEEVRHRPLSVSDLVGQVIMVDLDLDYMPGSARVVGITADIVRATEQVVEYPIPSQPHN